MSEITVILKTGEEKTLEVEEGWSLMEILRDAGIEEIEGACGGSMACATCHMYIHPDWEERVTAYNNEKSDEEEDMLDIAYDIRPESRLGCQIRMSDDLDGLVIAVPGTKTKW
ncbi:MAG: 2Fe-2S iron-sulfur cluster-binding protein [Alphaproteobacteria bacterium]|nr:2Fe-2S iron-sulfur cluster-binding protein [Alphaproteobacteria bacterium]